MDKIVSIFEMKGGLKENWFD